MKPTKKQCTHSQTRLSAKVGKRILAICCSCERLVVQKAPVETRHG
jgi:hypothetical protein